MPVYPGATQMILRQPLHQRRRHQQQLAALTRNEISSHTRKCLKPGRRHRYSDSLPRKGASAPAGADDRFDDSRHPPPNGRLPTDCDRRAPAPCRSGESFVWARALASRVKQWRPRGYAEHVRYGRCRSPRRRGRRRARWWFPHPGCAGTVTRNGRWVHRRQPWRAPRTSASAPASAAPRCDGAVRGAWPDLRVRRVTVSPACVRR